VSSGSGSGSGGPKVASVKATATASTGMKAFLAMKRKATQGGGIESAKSSETSVDSKSSSSGTPPEVEKKFEGGFFLVSSPARTSSASNRASLRLQGKSSLPPANVLLRTPGAGRRLSSNLSLLSLSLRNSMGPMYKLGAKGDANSELTANSSETGSPYTNTN